MESLSGYDAWLEEPYQDDDEEVDREEIEARRENAEFDKGWDAWEGNND